MFPTRSWRLPKRGLLVRVSVMGKINYRKPVVAVEVSANAKIGTVSATYVAQGSCPLSCPFFTKGCYAEGGKVGIITAGLNAHGVTDPVALAQEEADGIDGLRGLLPLRLHVVGDCKTAEAARIVSEAAERYMKRGKRKTASEPFVWTYTHAHNVPRESWGKVSVLRSCETLDQVKLAHEEGYAAELTVAEFDRDTSYPLGDGYVGIPCPQQTGRAANCVECGLCMKDAKLRENKRVILLSAHGGRKKVAQNSIKESSASYAFPL
jgi:hypothetical protein